MAEAKDANHGLALRSSISTCINVGRYSLESKLVARQGGAWQNRHCNYGIGRRNDEAIEADDRRMLFRVDWTNNFHLVPPRKVSTTERRGHEARYEHQLTMSEHGHHWSLSESTCVRP